MNMQNILSKCDPLFVKIVFVVLLVVYRFYKTVTLPHSTVAIDIGTVDDGSLCLSFITFYGQLFCYVPIIERSIHDYNLKQFGWKSSFELYWRSRNGQCCVCGARTVERFLRMESIVTGGRFPIVFYTSFALAFGQCFDIGVVGEYFKVLLWCESLVRLDFTNFWHIYLALQKAIVLCFSDLYFWIQLNIFSSKATVRF